ncbi:hypothetical protein LWI29_035345 [Acer saccharum]|uniref:Uncharacterized protein n=1 Tax=Acer saccharum TaxID=4024 RepID=A0AA39W7L9_ACESA|nr:hypothetical protein LWI29_035345 [Acer saccharum]
MGKAKKIGGNVSSTPIDKSRPTISSKISKANKVDELGIFGCKKLIQERGIDLDSCVGSYVYDVLISRNWNSWVNMLGISNETVVREFYHAYKSSSIVTSATLSIRKVVFRVCSRKVNEFLNLPDDIESEFLDVDILENLDLMGRTLCDDSNFVWGKRAYIKQERFVEPPCSVLTRKYRGALRRALCRAASRGVALRRALVERFVERLYSACTATELNRSGLYSAQWGLFVERFWERPVQKCNPKSKHDKAIGYARCNQTNMQEEMLMSIKAHK